MSFSQNWIQKGNRINGLEENDFFGGSVSLSSDGNTIAIGARDSDAGPGTVTGQVRVFTYNGSLWIQKGGNINGLASQDNSGWDIKLSDDGNTLAIGEPLNDNSSGTNAGQVRVFRFNGSSWVLKGQAITGEAADDWSGRALDISGDGNTLIIGAANNDGNGSTSGRAKVYAWSGSAWLSKGTDLDGEASGDQSGWDVSMSNDGNTISIGAIYNDGNGTNSGHVRIYSWSGSAWLQKGVDIDGEASSDQSGWAIGLSNDGNTIAIGAINNDGSGSNAGHVRIYSWNSTSWVQKGIDLNGESAGDQSGFSLAINQDGSTVAIGAHFNDGNGNDAGHVRAYGWDGNAWVLKGFELNGEGVGNQFGYDVSLSDDGNSLAIGSPEYDFNAGGSFSFRAGCARVYTFECPNTTSSISETACTSYTVPSGHETYTSSGIYFDTIPNTQGCDSIITINLTIDDVIAPDADVASLSNVTSQCQVTSLTVPTATDNCSGTINGTHNATLPITSQGTTVVTWTYNDGNGNTSTQTQNVVIDDVTAPVADVVTLSDVTSECSVTSLTAPTATDNCAGTITGTHNATLPITSQGTTVVTWTYDDGNGNTSSQTQNVVIDDVTAPVANVATLADVTAECSVTILTAPTATDNCAGTITGTHNATLPITTQGTTVLTWIYNDGNGNTSSQTQNVVIDDVTAPVANVATLADVTAECSVTSLTAPTAIDNCAGTITGTHNATLPITMQGTTVVTWTYDDGNGNTSTQTQNVIIDDVTAPVADVATLSDVTAECSVTSLIAPTATDNCAGTITGTHNATLPITAQGTTLVTWTYNDGNGNTSTQTQNVEIDDVTAPVADVATLTDVTSECSVTTLTAPTATDNCAGTITGTHNATLPITTQGTTVVTWTYNDGNGNTSTQTQNVVIDDVTAPVPNMASLSNVSSECSVTTLTAPTATDNCTGTITGTHDATLPITSQGTTVVTWTYDDGNGNISTQTQNVIITGPNVAVTQVDEITLSADLTGADYQWIDCDFGNQLLNGETNQTFVATANGSYAVIVDNGTCADTSNCFVISTVGLDEKLNLTQINLYPNPTNGTFTIDLGEKYEELSVKLIDNLGRVVIIRNYNTTDRIELNIENDPGLYLLEIGCENNLKSTFQIIKN